MEDKLTQIGHDLWVYDGFFEIRKSGDVYMVTGDNGGCITTGTTPEEAARNLKRKLDAIESGEDSYGLYT